MSDSVGHRRQLSAGGWYAVLGDKVTLLLPADERPRVADLWDLVDAGADFDEVLDGVLAGGIRTLTGFVLVGHGDSTRVLVRGDVSVTVSTAEGDQLVSGAGETMWADRTLTGVTGGTAVLEQPGPHDLALRSGIARVGSLVFGDSPAIDGASALAPAVRGTGATPDPDHGDLTETGTDTDTDTDPWTGPDTVDDAAGRPEPAPVVEQTEEAAAPAGQPVADVVPIEVAPSSGQHASVPRSYGAPTDDDPTPTGEQPAVVDPAAVVEPVEPAQQPGDADDHDGQTTIGPAADAFVRPGIPGQELAPPVVSRPVAKLVLSTGEVVDVDRTIIVGRAPEARRFASTDQPYLVTVASPHHEISSTHLEIRPGAGADHGSAVVTDLGSTNGTVLVQPGLPPEDLQAGIAVSLIPGAILDLGDGVTIQTTNP
ncbi:FHA domain-containing protein [Nocardioides sp. P5_C9_2]